MSKLKAVLNWSGGKDCSLALHKLSQAYEYEITNLITTVSNQYHRISMHGVREGLLEQQAKSIGIPLHKIIMPDEPSMETYNRLMKETLIQFKNQDITTSVFGDIFLEDLRDYREKQLHSLGFNTVFPIWKIPTRELAQEFIDSGFKAVIVCVDEKYLDKSFAGREFDYGFLADLPANVDPCGENGEFHTFVYEGPIFGQPIPIQKGEIVYRTYNTPNAPNQKSGFWYCDLLPA